MIGKPSERGFLQYDQVDGTYGTSIRCYESSSAEGPHLWVKVDGIDEEAVCHLTLDQAREFLASLGSAVVEIADRWGEDDE